MRLLRIRRIGNLLHHVVNMAVDNQQIEIPVEIRVEKEAAKAEAV